MNVFVVIPAYQPGSQLIPLVDSLIAMPGCPIVIVDDGSGTQYQHVFEDLRTRPSVTVLTHSSNAGKGAALKTGFAYVLRCAPNALGVVTADADGQHLASDILAVSEMFLKNPESLVLGSRQFEGRIPWSNRFGNRLTKHLVRLLVGQRLTDTQTGLRAIPGHMLAQLLTIPSSGYEFELDMLMAAKHQGIPIVEQPIATVYYEGNRSSHFDPLLDSLKIYFVLLRFTGLSLMTAILDNIVFFAAFQIWGSIAAAQVLGRVAAVSFNYPLARRAVFLSKEQHPRLLPKYLGLVAVSAAASYVLTQAIYAKGTRKILVAKIAAETLLFVFNFIVQRDFVFRRSRSSTTTDWDSYYRHTPWTARLTRRYTSAMLLGFFRRIQKAHPSDPMAIVELGGANSCFLDQVLAQLNPSEYHVVDLNEYGLELLRRRTTGRGNVYLHRDDLRNCSLHLRASIVFSVGLIEHFDPAGTRAVILAHFQSLRPGGFAVILFPTPTWLYRGARWCAEFTGMWQFPDERPLRREEISGVAAEHGKVVYEKTLWPLIFTQQMMVVQKSGDFHGL